MVVENPHPIETRRRAWFDPEKGQHGGPCEVAGCMTPSSYVEGDTRRTDKPGDTWQTHETVGPVRFFCAEHAPAKRRTRRKRG